VSAKRDDRGDVRRLRAAYDALPPGPKAQLRRVTSTDELQTSGSYLTLLVRTNLVAQSRWLAPVVFVFPAAEHSTQKNFQLGRYLKTSLHADLSGDELVARSLRFRRLIAFGADEPDALAHHLRKLVSHAFSSSNRRVDFGVLGADVLTYLKPWSIDDQRRRWASQFFTANGGADASPKGESAHV
jgi:CRISPR type I-E-associated protein CasB/Cse2